MGDVAIAKIKKHLKAGTPPADAAAACATIAILCSQSTQTPKHLEGICKMLLDWIDGDEEGVKVSL